MKSLKFFIRKLKYNHKRTFLVGLLFLLFIGVSVGYAFLNTSLNITGALNIAGSRWDIHFDNIEIEEGSVEATTSPTITDNTSISFSTTLNNPGEQYQFTVDLVNDGTYDAKLDSIEVTPTLTEEQQEYFKYIVEYTEGGEIKQGDGLDAGTSESIKVLVQYKENDDDSKYPGEDIEFNFLVTMNYIQGKGNEVHHTSLYSVLKDAAIEGTYAKEYTGEHHDSFSKEPSKKIYHWYGSNNTNGTAILDKNNVIFANHCWQMIRTTDTGGVKMIYNGEVEDGKCLNTRGNHVGYRARITQSMSTTYYYGTDYTYDKTNNVFSLTGTTSTGEIKVGEYTCKATTADGTCATLYLVDTLSSGTTYNVLPLYGNSHYSGFGTLEFNQQYNSPAYVGYMYNTVYPYTSKTMTSSETMLSSSSLGTTYWYANSVTWGSPTANQYNLDSPYQVSATTDYPNLVGEYTFRSSSQTNTATNVYYIAAVNNSTYYYIQLGNESGTTHDLSYYNYTYTYGDSYTDNGNGTYTINNPITINRSDWYTSYSNVGTGKYVCKNAVNDTCSDLWYTTATSNTSMTYIKVANNYKYAKGFTWDGSKYVLDNDTSTSFFEWNDTNKTSINNAHYTCWNEMGECTTISYIYYISGITPNYINITNGKSVEDAINEMLYNDDVNQVNSTIKTGVDAWYKHYLLEDFDDTLEDTIFCNDRSQNNSSTNGWNPDGGSTTAVLQFREYNITSDLSCPNDTDQFSVSNNKAKLTYKVGLMSSPEANILNNSNAQKTGRDYWLASPYYFNYGNAYGRFVSQSGGVYDRYLFSANGVRPAVSLRPGTRYSDGDGSMANPYVVE